MFHCTYPKCDFDACMECFELAVVEPYKVDEGFVVTTHRHPLYLFDSRRHPRYPEGAWNCDGCGTKYNKTKAHFEHVYHCDACLFDLCHNCIERDSEVVQAGRNIDRRSACAYQIVMSFGARDFQSEGFNSVRMVDGLPMRSGFDVAMHYHQFMSQHFFGSVKEGKRHMYLDWYSLQALPGTTVEGHSNSLTIADPQEARKFLKRPSFLNPYWAPLYRAAFREAKIWVFFISQAWLDSKWCRHEFKLLLEVMYADPHMGSSREMLFYFLDGLHAAEKHETFKWVRRELNRWAKDKLKLGPECWKPYMFPFTTKEEQDQALLATYKYVKKLVRFKPVNGNEQAMDSKDWKRNYQEGIRLKIPGFESQYAK